MTAVTFPAGFRLEPLRREHRRKEFDSGVDPVNDWLATKALQHQLKRLSTTKVLCDESNAIAGFYTLAIGQVDFSDLPDAIAKKLPRRLLPIAILAWLGVDRARHKQGLGSRLLAQALRDCYEASQTFAFIGIVVDCLNEDAKAFYQRWNFRELPGHPFRLFISSAEIVAMMNV
jgi:GNAT superfamily N-acetyltransferase